MSIETIREKLPDYAKDIRLNLSSLLSEDILTDQQKYGTIVASALASRNAEVIRAAVAEADGKLSAKAMEAAKAAAAIMGMNNIYYRFTHLVASDDYRTLPAKLRMNIIGKPGVEKADFELWSLAVSAVNGCGMCLDSHEAVLRKADVTKEAIQAAVRIASVVHAAAAILDGEDALNG